MKRKICSILLILVALCSLVGCNKNQENETKSEVSDYLTPDDYELPYYLSEEELPENMLYIVRDETIINTLKDGTEEKSTVTKYYPVYSAAEHTYDEIHEEKAGYDPSRIMWVNYNLDEGYIPTMYEGDKLIYKSSTYIPTQYVMEKFFDNGYTLGVCGLTQDLSQNYIYMSASGDNSGKGYVMTTSDAVGFEGLEAESVYLVSVGKERITPLNISMSGTVTGLKLMDVYPCDIRTGTEKIAADLTCNVHYFSSAETYMFGTFTFITEHIAQIHVPDYVTTGYYNINGTGLFRYIKGTTDYHKLKSDAYNETIYTYNEEGSVNGTTIGLTFDENDFLIMSPITEEENEQEYTYNQLIDNIYSNTNISNKTILQPNEDDYYVDNYEFIEVEEPITHESSFVYHIAAKNINNDELLNMRYIKNNEDFEPKSNIIYQIMFKEPTDDFDGYDIIKISETETEIETGIETGTETGTETETENETETETGTEIETENIQE